MFLPLLVLVLALVAANPYHKYPYVFILDVGNEELEKTNSEQIKISVPGGSLAVRFPAIGDGDTIAHVRVSSIDFGTNLKANIVDGGPGDKYVVVVLMGNPGVAYDAVMTIDTAPDSIVKYTGKTDIVDSRGDTEDANNSAEETDSTDINVKSAISESNRYKDDQTAEINGASSNTYSYTSNDNDKHGNVEEDDDSDDNVNDRSLSNDQDERQVQYGYSQDQPTENVDEPERQDEQNTNEERIADSNKFEIEESDLPTNNEVQDAYDRYLELKSNLYSPDTRSYQQNAVPVFSRVSNSVYDPEDSLEYDRTFNVEENQPARDANNNVFDAEDPAAVES